MCYLPKTPQDLPQWMLDDKDITYLVYQRKNASLPFYTPNYGKEASVHFQFVHEFYHHLRRMRWRNKAGVDTPCAPTLERKVECLVLGTLVASFG